MASSLLSRFYLLLRTEGVKGGALLPLTSTTTATKWLVCGLLAKPLLYFNIGGQLEASTRKMLKYNWGQNVHRRQVFMSEHLEMASNKKKQPNRKHPKQISFRVSESEYLNLERSAKVLNISVPTLSKEGTRRPCGCT